MPACRWLSCPICSWKSTDGPAFSGHLEHADGAEPRAPELLVHCHASILAQACNFGLTRMAQLAEIKSSIGSTPAFAIRILAGSSGAPQAPADPWPLGRYAARGGIAQAGLGYRFPLYRQAPVISAPKRCRRHL